ncbi:prolyl oligopeptidase family serine peptidase [Pedobacter sp. L105]|uniref:prolyl oligopeptidase family serine peptidase n=1 Tax=Pedobacter sp. L105 TaxID=1641871 RepID=UPI00131D8EE2|nr:prolyl oligopeptidase family serine peptidase [Pedobacter sp. L105]
MKKIIIALLFAATGARAQQVPTLTVEKIMRDQKWMGTSPSDYRWSADSRKVYFTWNPENKDKAHLYQVAVSSGKPVQADSTNADREVMPDYTYNAAHTLGVSEKGGDLYWYELKTNKTHRLTHTAEHKSDPFFLANGDLAFQQDGNIFTIDLKTNELTQLTNFVKGKKAEDQKLNQQDAWLKNEQSELFDVIKEKKKKAARGESGGLVHQKPLKALYLGDESLRNVIVSPDARYISYQLMARNTDHKSTAVPSYVTASGYTEDIPGRTKVGTPLPSFESFIYDQQKDSVYKVQTAQIPGIKDLPDYLKDYPKELETAKTKNADRKVNLSGPIWNTSGSAALVVAESQDNKDLWILKLEPSTGNLTLLDRQRDEAWIGGPGVGADGVKWIDNDHFYFQSEASGYSHLYTYDLPKGTKKQLTSGKWEVQQVQLSLDKKTFYFTANMEHPGITHFYSVSVNGGKPVKLTSMKGGNRITLSPDEKWLAIDYSYMNKPWELYIQANRPGAKAVQVTESESAEFKAYPWREPEMVTFKNRYGADVYARVYPAAHPSATHPAVVFVHGAGYLQNVHYWWSQYPHEYLFNNLLADNGYTVIDIDYTGSAGYGRDHRTGIYRHMGGKDLTDQVDGVKLLVDKYHVDPKHVGIYGGSYGGFITLMALFKEGDVFTSGGALRSVTDWAHYNHGYTSNILNEPFNDEIAYKQSSPIYFADGLKGNLLMCHGMVDENVHFQDIVRLSQRLIELGKNNWELAVFPVEDHGFVQPSSWTDEYKRIFKLFETTLKK